MGHEREPREDDERREALRDAGAGPLLGDDVGREQRDEGDHRRRRHAPERIEARVGAEGAREQDERAHQFQGAERAGELVPDVVPRVDVVGAAARLGRAAVAAEREGGRERRAEEAEEHRAGARAGQAAQAPRETDRDRDDEHAGQRARRVPDPRVVGGRRSEVAQRLPGPTSAVLETAPATTQPAVKTSAAARPASESQPTRMPRFSATARQYAARVHRTGALPAQLRSGGRGTIEPGGGWNPRLPTRVGRARWSSG